MLGIFKFKLFGRYKLIISAVGAINKQQIKNMMYS